MFMSKKEEKKMSQLLSCSVDPAVLTHIFTEDIKGDLLCLGESLNLFVEIVKSNNPQHLGYNELTAYIKDEMEEVDHKLFEPLKGFFELNSLLSGDDPLYIKKENIKSLVEMLVLINDVMVKNQVYTYFTQDAPVSYEEHAKRKADIFNAFTTMEKALHRFFKHNPNQLDLVAFIDKFKNVDNKKILKNSEKLLFIKKVFLGGDKRSLTAQELKRLMLMLADASKIAYDILHLPSVKHSEKEKEEMMESLKEDFETLSRNLYFSASDTEPLMTLDDIFGVIQEHFPEAAPYIKYKNAILQAKRILLDNDSEFFTGKELQTLFNDIILKNLNRGVFFFKAYGSAYNKEILDRPAPITRDLPLILASNAQEEEFKADFNRIAKDYWFFLDVNWIAPYKNEIERSPWGMFVTATLEDLVTRAFSHYVNEDPGAYGGYKMPRAKMQALLEDFKSFLNGQGIILPGREVNSAETIELMTALFQKQSDGNGDDIEVNEMVELITTMISGYRVSNQFYKEVSNICPLDYKGRYSPTCFQENFASVFDMQTGPEGRRFEEYYPKLAAYARSLGPADSDAFVSKLGIFTRPCSTFDDGTPVPVSKADTFMFFTGLLNIESTYTIFDRSGAPDGGYNNLLEVSELKRAYGQVYEQAIEAKVPKLLRSRARDVFFYLLDKGKEPSAFTMAVRIIPFGYPEKSADRGSVASVLKVISEGSDANKSNPFKCEKLR